MDNPSHMQGYMHSCCILLASYNTSSSSGSQRCIRCSTAIIYILWVWVPHQLFGITNHTNTQLPPSLLYTAHNLIKTFNTKHIWQCMNFRTPLSNILICDCTYWLHANGLTISWFQLSQSIFLTISCFNCLNVQYILVTACGGPT